MTLGTLSKDDDDSSENVGKKMNLHSFKLNCVYLELLNMPNARDVSWSWILKDFNLVQKEEGILFGYVHVLPSSETQGQSVWSGEKAGWKFSSMGERAPGYQLSSNYFQKFMQMPAPDWAQKMLCIIVPNRQTVSPEFFSWVRTRWLLSCHTCLVCLPSLCMQGKLLFSTFLTGNEGTTDESKKRLGCYQKEQFNLPREYSVFDSSQYIVNNRKFKMRRWQESQIRNSLTRQKKALPCITLFCTFLCRQLHDYPWKCLIRHVLWRT